MTAENVQDAMLDCIEKLSEARSRSESRVKWVRGLMQSGEISRDKLRHIQLIYDDTQASVNAGLDRLLVDVESGGADSEESFRALALRADANLNKLLKACDEVIAGGDRGALEATLKGIGSLLSVFVSAWKLVRGEAKERRAALVRRLEQTRWVSFDEIK